MSSYEDAHDRFHAAGFEPEEGLIRVHHEIAAHLEKCNCDWAGFSVEMNRESVELEKVAAYGLPMDVVATLRQAQLEGYSVADIVTMLTAEGWELRVVPQGSKVGDLFPAVEKIIRMEGDRFCVYSEDGTRSFGCYDTQEQAEERLRQIHSFSNAESIREGMFVRWNSSGGIARGRVEHVMTEGTLGVPGSSFSIEATPDDPAVLIRIYRQEPDGEWDETETLVGHRASTLTVISDLAKATKREDGEDFPPEAFAYVPDPERPSTWKLRLWDSLEERETRAQVGRAIAALQPGGFRGNRVEIPGEDIGAVKERIAAAWRKVWSDDDSAEMPPVLKQESYEPPVAVQEAAQRALEWISQGEAGEGFTDVGRARAAQLARGAAVSLDVIRRMRSYFARHENDAQAEGWERGEPGFPSPGRVAWDAWGGDAGRDWANIVWERAEKNGNGLSLTARQAAMYQKFEWIVDMMGPWDYGVGPNGAHYIPASENPFIDSGIACRNCVFFRGGGGCEILSGPVEADGACKLWIIPEGLVSEPGMEEPEIEEPDDDDYEEEPMLLLGKNVGDLRKAEERRFTMGPWYIPDMLDAHGEFTDAEELQTALWRYVQSGDRRIRLQHNVSVVAGEAVEMMTWPYPVTLPLSMADGTTMEREFPPNTVFLGVIWEPWAWEYVKEGRISGYSIGGRTDRVMVDLPE